MDQLKLGRRISPFETCKTDIAITLLMCHEAISLLHTTWLQPPHWDEEPTDEELEYQQSLEEQAEYAEEEVVRLAGAIYTALTGLVVERAVAAGMDYEREEIPF